MIFVKICFARSFKVINPLKTSPFRGFCPKDIGVICFEHVNGLTTENNHSNGFCTYKLNDRPSDQIPIYVFAFDQEDIGKSTVFRVMVRNTSDGFEYVDRDDTHIYGEAVMNPLISKYVITQCLL